MLTRRMMLRYLAGTGVLGICGLNALKVMAFNASVSSELRNSDWRQQSVVDALQAHVQTLNSWPLQVNAIGIDVRLRADIEECTAVSSAALSVVRNRQSRANAILQASADSCRRLSQEAERCLAGSTQKSGCRVLTAIVQSSRTCERLCVQAVRA